MKAFVIVSGKITHSEKFKEYAQKASKTLEDFNVKLVGRGNFSGVLAGEPAHHEMSVILEFENEDAIDTWYNSSAYQALIPIRDEAAEFTISKYSTF